MIRRLITETKTQRTPNIAHGRFKGLRSPLLEINGMENNKKIVSNGPTVIAIDSILCGINAKRAKNGIIYQSGVGEVLTTDGSGWLPSAGAPKNIASKMIAITMPELNIPVARRPTRSLAVTLRK